MRTRWAHVKQTRTPEATRVARALLVNKDRYVRISLRSGVPWFVIAVIHNGGASGKWDANITNGQPFAMRTTLVPRAEGRSSRGKTPPKPTVDARDDAYQNQRGPLA